MSGTRDEPGAGRRRIALGLWRRGHTQVEIAAILGVSRWRARALLHGGRAGGPVVVACGVCGRELAQGASGLLGNGEVLCPDCLAGREAVPFAAHLRARRLAAGLTQEALAARARLSPTSVWQYEQGETVPRPSTLARLAEVLGPGLPAPERPAARCRRSARTVGRRAAAGAHFPA